MFYHAENIMVSIMLMYLIIQNLLIFMQQSDLL